MQSSLDIVKSNLAAMPAQGIRRTNVGWAAVSRKADGRVTLIDSFKGAGAKRKAIQAAGTSTVIA